MFANKYKGEGKNCPLSENRVKWMYSDRLTDSLTNSAATMERGRFLPPNNIAVMPTISTLMQVETAPREILGKGSILLRFFVFPFAGIVQEMERV